MRYRLFLLLVLTASAGATVAGAQGPAPASKPSGRASQSAPTPPPPPMPDDAAQGGEDEQLSVSTTLVTVPARVMDRDGRFVPGLSADDFLLYEEGQQQEIAFFAPVETPFSVVLLIDTSPSTQFSQQEIKDAAIAFIDQLRPEDNVMVVSFNGSIKVLNKSTTNREQLRRAIRGMSWGSGTLLYGTVDALLNKFFKRLGGRKALVMLTDGQDNDPRLAILAHEKQSAGVRIDPSCEDIPCATAAENLRDVEESDTIIYPVQFKEPLDEVLRREKLKGKAREALVEAIKFSDSYLDALAQKTGGRLYHAGDTAQLRQSFGLIAEELRRQYSLGYYPKEQPHDGERRAIRVRVNRPGLAVRARDSYVYGAPRRPETSLKKPRGN